MREDVVDPLRSKAAPGKPWRHVHQQASSHCLREQLRQLLPAVPFGRIQRQHRMRPHAQDAPHQSGQDQAGAALDKDPHAGRVERLDFIDESHRFGDVARQQPANLVLVFRIRFCRQVAEHRDARRREGDVGQCVGQRAPGRRHVAAVKRSRHRQALDPHAVLRQCRLRRLDRILAAGDDRLVRRIQIRGRHRQAVARDRGRRRFAADVQRRHGAARGHGRQTAAHHRYPDQVVTRDGAGGAQGHVFAVAVPGHEVGPQTVAGQHVECRQAGHAECRLGNLGRIQRLALGVARGVIEGRQRIDQVGDARLRRVACRRLLEARMQRGKARDEFAQHVDPLRPLAGKQETDAAHRPHAFAVVQPRRLAKLALLGQQRQRALQLLAQVGARSGHQHQPARLTTVGMAHDMLFAVEREGQLGKVDLRRARQAFEQAPHRPLDLVAGGAGEGEQLHVARLQADQVCRPVGTGVLGQHRVEIGAAKAKCADPAAPRMGASQVQPGSGFAVDVQRRAGRLQFGNRPFDPDRWWQHPVLQRQRGLDQASQTRDHLGMADHRLDRPDRAGGRRGLTKHHAERRDFGLVAQRRARAVGLDQRDAGRIEPGFAVGTPYCRHLPGRMGRSQATVAAVAGAADTIDDGIDAVAVALSVGQALEHHGAHAFADGNAVGARVEWPRAAAWRQRVGLGKRHVANRAVGAVDAAHQGDIGVAVAQLPEADLERGERRCAGGVHGEVAAAQVEPVGDPSCHHVAEDARECILGPFRQYLLEQRVDDVAPGLFRQAVDLVQVQGQQGPEIVDRAQLVHAANRHDAGGALAGERALGKTGVLEGLARHLERQQLRRLDDAQGRRRDAVVLRVECDVVEEAAPFRIDPVGRAPGIEQSGGRKALVAHLGDRIDAVQDILPVGA